MLIRKRNAFIFTALILVVLTKMSGILSPSSSVEANQANSVNTKFSSEKHSSPNQIMLTEQQVKSIKVEVVILHDFVMRQEAVGYIDFNQEKMVQVFSPWQGRIVQTLAKAGDQVKKSQALFIVDSPDLVQAESTLISTASTLQLTSKTLERAKKLIEIQANTQKDLEQAIADRQTAEGNFKAARDAVRIYGKSNTEIDEIVANQKNDGKLVITSPFSGLITARNASDGMLVQPGMALAPFSVADLSNMWMVANVSEYDLPQLRLGQHVSVYLAAYPGRNFEGVVTNIGAVVDPATHHIPVRSSINDQHHELKPQMLATFVINTGKAISWVAVPPNGVINESDGTVSIFVTNDGRLFQRRLVKLGITHNGMTQIVESVSVREKVATNGALFLSKALSLQSD